MKRVIYFLCFLLSGCNFWDNLTDLWISKFEGKAYIVSSNSSQESYERLFSKLKSFGIDCDEFKPAKSMSAEQHREIWRKIATSDESLALVVEDNVCFEQKFKRKFLRYVQDLPQDWDIAFLVVSRENNKYGYFISVGDIFRDIDEVQGHPYVAKIQKTNKVYGLYGYVINKKGAKKLLKLTENANTDICDIIFQKGGINTGYVKAYVSMFKLMKPKLSETDINKMQNR